VIKLPDSKTEYLYNKEIEELRSLIKLLKKEKKRLKKQLSNITGNKI